MKLLTACSCLPDGWWPDGDEPDVRLALFKAKHPIPTEVFDRSPVWAGLYGFAPKYVEGAAGWWNKWKIWPTSGQPKGQILWSGKIVVDNPKYYSQIYGWTAGDPKEDHTWKTITVSGQPTQSFVAYSPTMGNTWGELPTEEPKDPLETFETPETFFWLSK